MAPALRAYSHKSLEPAALRVGGFMTRRVEKYIRLWRWLQKLEAMDDDMKYLVESELGSMTIAILDEEWCEIEAHGAPRG